MTVTDTELSVAPPPAPALTPASAIARAGAPRFDDLRALCASARSFGADGAANRLVPHVVLPALLGGAPPGVVTTALGEAGEDFDLDAVTCAFDGRTLTGRKPLVSGALESESALVAARTDDGVVLVLVRFDAAGVQRRPLRTLGRLGDADVRFDHAAVDVVVDAATVAARTERAFAVATLVQAAEGAGILHQLLEYSLAQGHERYAFGRPVGSFMAFQHMCAEIAMERELADTAVDRAAVAGTALATAQARLFVGGAAVRAARTGVQLQGGKGFLDDSPVARLYRQAKESQLRWGAPRLHQRRLAADLLEG
ncbi:MAG TPA: acyl-CoA dehydrogenase family protein [Solirubrobacter sp.]|nr:acyl-CoA dehydrogenase family protein [Solirubrobacter sp.]